MKTAIGLQEQVFSFHKIAGEFEDIGIHGGEGLKSRRVKALAGVQ